MKIRQPKPTSLVDAAPSLKAMPRPSMDHVLLDAICRTDFASFIRKCFHSLAPGSSFLMNWHIYALAHHLEQVRLGKIRRLIINMPPRSLR